jgi:phosphonate transport system substrate-binding protein
MTTLQRLLAAACGLLVIGSACAAESCEDPRPLRFAVSPTSSANGLREQYKPLLASLEQRLGRRVVLSVPSSYQALISELLSGNVDLASMGPASYAIAKNQDPSVTAFATVQSIGGEFTQPGGHTYRSLLIALKGHGIARAQDLKGRDVMLSDPASTSGSVIPRKEFGDQVRMSLEQYFGKLGYSGSHDRSLETLKKGYVDAVFVASVQVDRAIRAKMLAPADIVVLWQSQPIPFDPFIYRGALCPALRDKIRSAFLASGADAGPVLEKLYADSFVAVEDQEYSYLRSILSSSTVTPE